MIDKRFPNWDVDVEKGTVYSLYYNKPIGVLGNHGYYMIGKEKILKHRLIWMVANQCEIPEGYDIHHIDGDKTNNSIYNLELIEHKEHVRNHSLGHTIDLYGVKNPFYGKHHTKDVITKLSKKVIQYDLDNNLVKIWDSFQEIGRNGFNHKNVHMCCQGKRKTHKGFIWKYYEEQKDVA